MARPKACMAEGHLKEECLGFVTKYLQRFDMVQMPLGSIGGIW